MAVVIGVAILGGCAKSDKMAQDVDTHAEMEKVMTSFADTPRQWGLLPTAIKETDVAVEHSAYAASKLDDLRNMRTHITHVIHALDPTVIGEGPGFGYGALKATRNAAAHIDTAMKSASASKNVKLHSLHVITSADNAAKWASDALAASQKVLSSSTAAEAAPLVEKVKMLVEAMQKGIDANGDGKIGWKKGEGGLSTANQHMVFMLRGEGMAAPAGGKSGY